MPPKIKFKTSERSTAVASLVGKHHAHGCKRCTLKYTDACTIPGKNGVCMSCQHGHQRPLWNKDLDPRSCCFTDAKVMEEMSEVARYSLGGPGPWYKCATCSRTHPYFPKKENSR